MPTPSIQTLRTDAQQVLNLDSISAVRSVVAATLANANAGTPLNPNLTTQQLWNEFYQIVTQPKSDIESIIANQLMKFLYAPPAPGGVGADGQVIFNDGGVLAGDPQFLWNKTTNLLTVTGSATITGALAANADTTLGTASKSTNTNLNFSSDLGTQRIYIDRGTRSLVFQDVTSSIENYRIAGITGVHTWGVGGSTAMTLNANGLGVGITDTTNGRLSVRAGTAATGNSAFFQNLDGTYNSYLQIQHSSNGVKLYTNSSYGGDAGNLTIGCSSAVNALIVNGSGNVGIGVTPSAWATTTTVWRALDLQYSCGIASSGAGSGEIDFLWNAYYDQTDQRWEFKYTGDRASRYAIGGSGVHAWYNTSSTGTANNPITWTQAMTLDASGNLLVGTTTANGRVAVDTDLAVYNGMSVKNTGTTYGASSFFFRFINSSGATAGSIQHTAVTTTNYSTTSDARLKESKGISNDTSVIDNTVVHDFIWKADGSTDRGVFAQEAHAVKPRAVSVGSDELTEDGNIKTPWSVDYSKFVPDLIVYCQQLKKQVVELTARVQTLEAK